MRTPEPSERYHTTRPYPVVHPIQKRILPIPRMFALHSDDAAVYLEETWTSTMTAVSGAIRLASYIDTESRNLNKTYISPEQRDVQDHAHNGRKQTTKGRPGLHFGAG